MKIITWNLDNSDIDIIKRMKLLVDIISREEPDILCFQEVTKKAFDYLKNNLHYHFTEFNNEYSYRNIIASKNLIKDVNLIKLSSSMNRAAIHCKINDIDIVNFHLESMPINHNIRREQLKQILSHKFGEKIIMCGDTNFIFEHEKFDDSFIDCGPNEPSYNYLENKRILGPYISYLDKIYIKGIDYITSYLLKNDEISDHFGISAVINI